MRPSLALETHRSAIRRLVAAHRARNARVFGSVAAGADHDGSDLDLLVDPTPETTLLDIGAIRTELRRLLGVPVEVLTPAAGTDPRRHPGPRRRRMTTKALRVADCLGHMRAAIVRTEPMSRGAPSPISPPSRWSRTRLSATSR